VHYQTKIFSLIALLALNISCFQSPVPQGFNAGKKTGDVFLIIKPIAPSINCGFVYSGNNKDFEVLSYTLLKLKKDDQTGEYNALEEVRFKRMRVDAVRAKFKANKELKTDYVLYEKQLFLDILQENEKLLTDIPLIEPKNEFSLLIKYHGNSLEKCLE